MGKEMESEFGSLLLKAGMEAGVKEGIKVAVNTFRDKFREIKETRYGSVYVCFVLVVDFAEVIRLDEWKIKLNDVLTRNGFRRDGSEYVADEVVRIKDISAEYLYIPLNVDEDDESFDSEVDDGILYVKRMRIFAIPEKIKRGSIVEVASKLANIAEEFLNYVNMKKTFICLQITFKDGVKASKFKESIDSKLNEVVGDKKMIYVDNNRVDINILSLSNAVKAFEIIEDELLKKKGILKKIIR